MAEPGKDDTGDDAGAGKNDAEGKGAEDKTGEDKNRGGAEPENRGGAEPEKRFTQADLDAAVETRLARERRLAERKERGKSKPFDQEADDNEEDAKLERRLAGIEDRLLSSTARSAALDAGASARRATAVVRLADLKGLSSDDGEDISDAVVKVLEEYPELRVAGGVGGVQGDADAIKGKDRQQRSTTDRQESGARKTWTRGDIDKMSSADYAKNREAIMAALQEGRIK